VFETRDFDSWLPAQGATEPPEEAAFPAAERLPSDAGSRPVRIREAASRLYAFGPHFYRSDDGGRHWLNLTRFRGESIIGGGMRDVAVSPLNPDEVAVANDVGVWRSLDGGDSWSGLNYGLPNLPIRRLLATPAGSVGLTALLDSLGTVEWAPGEKLAWRRVPFVGLVAEEVALQAARARLGAPISAIAVSGDYVYAGARDGRIWVSSDRGRNWRASRQGSGAIEALHVDAEEPLVALAALSASPDAEDRPLVLRTINGGIFWDDLTADLPGGNAHGVCADRASGAIYAATDHGVFLTFGDLIAPGPATAWMALVNLPQAPAADVRLDPAGNQLYVALQGYGVYAAPAPHRFRNPRPVNAADFSVRAAAPGSLLTVLGARVVRAQVGLLDAPILHATELESQIQVPFETAAPKAALLFEDATRTITLELPVQGVSPAIFVDPDGTPLLLDGDSGQLLDVMKPARGNSRVQILATGLGRVRPDWPTGMAAPLETPPEVVAPVRAFIDRQPVEVTRATLAPGFIGFYLLEIRLPAIVNTGPAELYVQAGDQLSNRVRIYLEP
jgi:uncharacterized protein (TIGR03437 family)